MYKVLTIVLLCLICQPVQSQFFLKPSPVYRQDRLKGVVITEAAMGIALGIGLHFLWYKKFPRTKIHFFNDNNEWFQVDKVGHAATAYNVALVQYDLMRWSGLNNNQSIIVGSATALGFLTMVEIFDGFSQHWGFSKGDMVANIVGTALFAAQQKGWNEQRIGMKFSAHLTPYAKYYPQELGNNLPSRIMKDYNGQTYWLSFNIASFLPSHSSFPKWLNMAVGYGGDGMIGARTNPADINGKAIPYFKRNRQWYLSPDIDLYRIQNNNDVLRAAFYASKVFKVPAPALEINSGAKAKFHWLYF